MVRVSVHVLPESCYMKNLLLIFCLICQLLKIIILLVWGNALLTIVGSLFLSFKMF